MKSTLLNLIVCSSISLSFIMAGEVQNKLNQMSMDMNKYVALTEATSDDLSVLQSDIKSFFANKFLSLQTPAAAPAAAANTTNPTPAANTT
jgi:hypothetical protein